MVGIETDDDVSMRGDDAVDQLLEQDKHSVQRAAEPFGDRSKDLWNTLSIWLEALKDGEVVARKTRFVMVTNKVLPNCIARKIGRSKSEPEIDLCIAELEQVAKSPPAHIKKFITAVLEPTSRVHLRSLIHRCECVDGSDGSAGDALRAQSIAHLQLPEWCAQYADSLINELLGWMHTFALTNWQQQKPAWIKRQHFVNQLHAIIDVRKRNMTRERAECLIPVDKGTVGQEKGNVFVRQLHLVTSDDSIVDGAIRDFIRCNIEKDRLSAEGNITDDDWIAFESTLYSRWDRIRGRVVNTNHSPIEQEVGFEILTDTTESHREKLAGNDTEQIYLTSGTYHRMAGLQRVGWHPRYKQILSNSIPT